MDLKTEILNYENRLLEDRKILNDLIAENNNDKLINNKIQFLQNELNYMNQQLNILKSNNQIKDTVPIAQPIVQNTSYYNIKNVEPAPIPVQNVHNKDLEKTIGKAWMGIFASVLIFISIILFSTLVLPILGDGFKMFIMYLFSIALTIFSILKVKKDNTNKLFLSLLGCGIGSVYISLLLTNMYFKAIGDITLYIGILIWGIAICFLSVFNSYIFQIIGNIGITISLICGSLMCLNNSDDDKFLVLIIFYIISSLCFSLTHCSSEYKKNIISNAFLIFNTFILILPNIVFNSGVALALILLNLIFYIIFFAFKCEFYEKSFGYGFFIVAINHLFIIYDLMFIHKICDGTISFCIFYIISFVLFAICEFRLNNLNKYIIEVTTLIQLFIVSLIITESLKILIIFAFIFILYSVFAKENTFKISSLIYTFFALFTIEGSVLLSILCFVLLLIQGFSFFTKYNTLAKKILIINLYVLIISVFANILNFKGVSIFVIISLIHLVCSNTLIANNFENGQVDSKIFLYFINAILMICGSCYILDCTNIHFFIILISLALFFNNSKALLETNSKLCQFYVCAKFTFLLIIILSSFDTINLIISISCLLFAILSIILGFRLDYKTLRVYGLVLANLSVIKLILIDISHNSTASLAISFFICGILCFAISFIYNRLEQNSK